MSSKKRIPHNQKPTSLHPAERDAPLMVLHEFFLIVGLEKSRSMLWHWLKQTITGNYIRESDEEERKELLAFYEQIQKLVEASYLISVYYRQRQKKQTTVTEK